MKLPLISRVEDDLLPLSALNDLLFCERRCALHRLEQLWTDNGHTLEGTHGHRRVHETHESKKGRFAASAACG